MGPKHKGHPFVFAKSPSRVSFFRKSVLPNESVIELILKTMFDASQLTKQEIQEVTIILIGFLKVAGDQTGCLTLHIFTEDEKENVEIVNTNSTQCINVP